MNQNAVPVHDPACIPRLFTVREFCEHHPWATIGGLRHLIFHEKTNGFGTVVRRCGRRVLIDQAAFFAWLEEQNSGAENHG